MRCPDCGAESGGDYKFCPRCGYPFDPYVRKPSPTYAPTRRGSESSLIIVIVVIVVAAMVAAPLLLYLMVLGSGSVDRMTPDVGYGQVRLEGGLKITIVAITNENVPWDDVRVRIEDGGYYAEWELRSQGLDGGALSSATYSVEFLATRVLNLTVTDLRGDGLVSGMDYFVVTSDPFFSPSSAYTAYLIYEPTGGRMGAGITFTG